MPNSCGVVGCSSLSGRDDVRFYRLPAVITGQCGKTKEYSERRRRLWLAAIRREMSDVTKNNLRICSRHFITGVPSDLFDDTNPDWVPSVSMGYGSLSTSSGERHRRLVKRKQNFLLSDKENDYPSSTTKQTGACFITEENIEVMETVEESSELEQTKAEVSRLSSRLADLQFQISSLETTNKKLQDDNEGLQLTVKKVMVTSPDDFKDDDEKVKYFTGLPSFVTLMALFQLISPEINEAKNSVLNRFQKMIITLMRLRLNLSIVDLSYRFGAARSTISKVFLEIIEVMYQILVPKLIRWPEREELYQTMPMVFRKHFGRKVTVIIDCFEIFIDRPSNLTARAQTWSNYKHHNTAKYLIGITPQGSVSFISEGWGGRVSDKHLTANSKFLDNLQFGDLILADRGFDIQDLVALVGAEVNYPAFTRGKNQLSATEVESTRKIANVRIHVERVIGTVRQKFSILGATCPIDFLSTKGDSDIPVLDKIVSVCCALTNLCPSVVSCD